MIYAVNDVMNAILTYLLWGEVVNVVETLIPPYLYMVHFLRSEDAFSMYIKFRSDAYFFVLFCIARSYTGYYWRYDVRLR